MGEIAPNEGTNDMTAIENPTAAPRSPLDDLAPDLRAWLVGEMGMEVELGGGGCTYLRHEGPHGSYILVTCYGGGGMPSHDSWQVGTYCTADGDSVLDFASDQDAVTLRMAVGAACGVLADFAPPPIADDDDENTISKETRIERARAALAAHNSDDSGDAPFIDLIADLLITAQDDGHDVEQIVRCARMHHEHEG